MRETNWLAERFEENRSHLRAVAYRMLGSTSEADDAVQEAWLRISRTDTSDVENLGGWLTTVVSRVCLDMLRSRTSRREEPMSEDRPEPIADRADGHDPEHDAIMADSIGAAMLVVLDTLAPAERLAFVLHDMFGVPFEEIAPIVERTTTATRQLASRARRRVRGASEASSTDLACRRAVVDAFLVAARNADFETLVTLLDPDAVVRADRAAAAMGGESGATGATAVAKFFSGRALAARPVLVDGVPAAAWAPRREPRVVFAFTMADGKITAIDLIADPERLAAFDLEFLTGYATAPQDAGTTL